MSAKRLTFPIVVTALVVTVCFNPWVLGVISAGWLTGSTFIGGITRFSYVLTHWAVFLSLPVLVGHHVWRARRLALRSLQTLGVATWVWCVLVNLPIPAYSRLGFNSGWRGHSEEPRTGFLSALAAFRKHREFARLNYPVQEDTTIDGIHIPRGAWVHLEENGGVGGISSPSSSDGFVYRGLSVRRVDFGVVTDFTRGSPPERRYPQAYLRLTHDQEVDGVRCSATETVTLEEGRLKSCAKVAPPAAP